jgi:hypothetical protein
MESPHTLDFRAWASRDTRRVGDLLLERNGGDTYQNELAARVGEHLGKFFGRDRIRKAPSNDVTVDFVAPPR